MHRVLTASQQSNLLNDLQSEVSASLFPINKNSLRAANMSLKSAAPFLAQRLEPSHLSAPRH